MTKRDILIFIFKWKATFFFGTLFIVGLVTALVYVMPPNYTAVAKVLVERLKSPVKGDAISGAQSTEVQNTEIEILLSRPVMAAVVDKLKPQQRPSSPPRPGQAPASTDAGTQPPAAVQSQAADVPAQAAAPEDDSGGFDIWAKLADWGLINAPPARERWIARLMKGVKVKAVVDSNILEISYSDFDPVWAAKIVNTVTETYLAHRLEVYAARGASLFYKEQMEEAHAALQKMRERLSDYKTREGIPALEETRRDLVGRIGTLRERMVSFQSELSDLLGRFSEGHQRIVTQRQKMAALQRDLDDHTKRLLRLEQYVAAVQTLDAEIAGQDKVYQGYRERYEDRRMMEAQNVDTTNVRIIGQADIPAVPSVSRLFFIALSVAGGLFLTILIALIREYFDRRVNDPDVVERILGVPVLGSVAKFRI